MKTTSSSDLSNVRYASLAERAVGWPLTFNEVFISTPTPVSRSNSSMIRQNRGCSARWPGSAAR